MPSDSLATNRPRTYYLDNFKSYLIALVVYHHTSISYGGDGGNINQSRFHPPGSSVALIGFNALNQAFFMGSFFFVSGYYSAQAAKRKPLRRFVKDKLYRLGVPTAVYTLLGPPTCQAIVSWHQGQRVGFSLFLESWKSLRGIRGPVWFTGLLLAFDLTFILLKQLPTPSKSDESLPLLNDKKPLSPKTIGIGIATCAALSFVTRLSWPVGRTYEPLSLKIGYLPQYIAAYVLGLYVHSPTDIIPSPPLAGSLLLASITSSVVAIVGISTTKGNALDQIKGGFNILSACYSVWNETTGYLIGTSLLGAFQKYADWSWGAIPGYAYLAFLVHMPVSVLIETCTDGWYANAVVKTAVIGALNMVSSWMVAWCWSNSLGRFFP